MFQNASIPFIGTLLASSAWSQSTAADSTAILSDPGVAGPRVEVTHLYHNQWPTGIAVSSSGRMFSNYPPALDPGNSRYTVAELHANHTETPYPNAEINAPPGGQINYTSTPPSGANYQDRLIGVQSVVIDPADRLWILDTGRATTQDGVMVPASFGGPKLIGVDLRDDSIFTTIVFSPAAAPPGSYLNDVRFDLNPALTPSGQGVAYITDTFIEGQNAIVVVDLGAKTAWRHLQNMPSVTATPGFVPTIWGEKVSANGGNGAPVGNINFGADGIALSADGATLYFATTAGRELYSIPTAYLLDNSSPSAAIRANGAVRNLGDKGYSDGMETDSNDNIYAGDMEANAITIFNPATGLTRVFVRDPRFSWTDTLSVAADGYLYFTENQLWLGPMFHGGVDRRVKPFVLFRVKLEGNATKVTQRAPGMEV